jgi:hypothetical protein
MYSATATRTRYRAQSTGDLSSNDADLIWVWNGPGGDFVQRRLAGGEARYLGDAQIPFKAVTGLIKSRVQTSREFTDGDLDPCFGVGYYGRPLRKHMQKSSRDNFWNRGGSREIRGNFR